MMFKSLSANKICKSIDEKLITKQIIIQEKSSTHVEESFDSNIVV